MDEGYQQIPYKMKCPACQQVWRIKELILHCAYGLWLGCDCDHKDNLKIHLQEDLASIRHFLITKLYRCEGELYFEDFSLRNLKNYEIKELTDENI